MELSDAELGAVCDAGFESSLRDSELSLDFHALKRAARPGVLPPLAIPGFPSAEALGYNRKSKTGNSLRSVLGYNRKSKAGDFGRVG
jgi:hypothetical protein